MRLGQLVIAAKTVTLLEVWLSSPGSSRCFPVVKKLVICDFYSHQCELYWDELFTSAPHLWLLRKGGSLYTVVITQQMVRPGCFVHFMTRKSDTANGSDQVAESTCCWTGGWVRVHPRAGPCLEQLMGIVSPSAESLSPWSAFFPAPHQW